MATSLLCFAESFDMQPPMICLPGLCPRSQRGGGPKLSQQASVFPSCTPRIRSLRAFRKASKKLLLLLLLRTLIITTHTQKSSLEQSANHTRCPDGVYLDARFVRAAVPTTAPMRSARPLPLLPRRSPRQAMVFCQKPSGKCVPLGLLVRVSLFCRALTRKVTTPSSWCGSAVPNNTPKVVGVSWV